MKAPTIRLRKNPRAMEPLERAALVRQCRVDRDYLLNKIRVLHGFAHDPVPAEVLDEIIEDLLGLRLAPCILPGSLLGRCNFLSGEMGINTQIEKFARPNTNVSGVINFTKAHEIGHIRLGHEMEVRTELDGMTLPMFGPEAEPEIVCWRDWEGREHLTEAQRRREQQADVYAAVFLIPERRLLALPDTRAIEKAWRAQQRVPSQDLWDMVLRVASHFHVTGQMMSRTFIDLGWLVINEARELSVHPQQLLPFEAESA